MNFASRERVLWERYSILTDQIVKPQKLNLKLLMKMKPPDLRIAEKTLGLEGDDGEGGGANLYSGSVGEI